MIQIERSLLIPINAEKIFDLVMDIQSYPQFIGGCVEAKIHSEKPDEVVAGLVFRRGKFKAELMTCNRIDRPTGITMQLSKGPFKHLSGQWRFKDLMGQGTKVSLTIELEMEALFKWIVTSKAVAAEADKLVSVFEKEAMRRY